MAEEIALAAEMGVIQMNIVGFDKPTIDAFLVDGTTNLCDCWLALCEAGLTQRRLGSFA